MKTLPFHYELTADERRLIFLLRKAVEKHAPAVTVRFAGGWVRDRLLGLPSKDIDVAVDMMSGQEFAKLIASMTNQPVAVIKANPDQSKHLETARMTLFGIEVDFANLRSEEYGESRIPTIKVGTPQQDAERRDLSINALFLNIHTMQVEDYVDGLEDMVGLLNSHKGTPVSLLLRTPTDPDKTFSDDPLRILRVLRFYSRFPNSFISAKTLNGIQKNAKLISDKVSVERVQDELMKLLDGAQPWKAMGMAHMLKVMVEAFDCPSYTSLQPFNLHQQTPYHKYTVWQHTLETIQSLHGLLVANGVTGRKKQLALLAALFHDFGKCDPAVWAYKVWNSKESVAEASVELANDLHHGNYLYHNETGIRVRRTYHGHAESSSRIAKEIMEKLKFSNDDIDFVGRLVYDHMGPHSDKWTDKALRKMIHRWGSDWPILWWHAIADSISSGVDKPLDIAEKYERMARARELEATDCSPPTNKKPVLSGNIIMEIIPELSPKTKFIKEVQDRLQDLRFEDPSLDEFMACHLVRGWKADLLERYRAK